MYICMYLEIGTISSFLFFSFLIWRVIAFFGLIQLNRTVQSIILTVDILYLDWENFPAYKARKLHYFFLYKI